MNKKTIILLSVALLFVVSLSIWQYIEYKQYCKTNLPSNTIINDIDCSDMTLAEAKETLTAEWNKKEFVVMEDEKEIGVLKDLSFTYDIDQPLQEVLDNTYTFPLITYLFNKNQDLSVTMTVADTPKSFRNQIDQLPIYQQDEPIPTQDAYVDLSNHDFEIIPEVYGNTVDPKLVETAVLKNIAAGTFELDFVEKDYYEQPEIKSDNPELLERQEYCKAYYAHELSYDIGGTTYTISPAQMDTMMYKDDNGKVVVKPEGIEAFVAELAEKYDTVGTTRLFKSTARGEVYVYGGTYGYAINQPEEVKQLSKDLLSKKDIHREPIYAQEGWGWNNNGFGSTYVEVDLALQTAWYYQNGKALFSCPIVSGCAKKNHHTITGAYQIVYKATDVTLKGGSKKKKTYYESHVDYWMPFCGDYGLHDADWRAAFGGSIYINDGSHGCVNMPPASAQMLYNNASTGTPVIVFY